MIATPALGTVGWHGRTKTAKVQLHNYVDNIHNMDTDDLKRTLSSSVSMLRMHNMDADDLKKQTLSICVDLYVCTNIHNMDTDDSLKKKRYV